MQRLTIDQCEQRAREAAEGSYVVVVDADGVLRIEVICYAGRGPADVRFAYCLGQNSMQITREQAEALLVLREVAP